MDYAKPEYSVQKVNSAGKFLATFDPESFNPVELSNAIDVIAQFRVAHHFPLDKGNSKPWDQLKVEIQLRTLLQHRWATAVEVAGTFTNTALKSNRGNAEWLRFFALVSSVFALKEGSPTVPGTSSDLASLTQEIAELNSAKHIVATLEKFHALVPQLGLSRARFYLVILNPATSELKVQPFKKDERTKADEAYAQAEKAYLNKPDVQVVLVSVPSAKSLQRAYPNYFLDTEDFLREVTAITRN